MKTHPGNKGEGIVCARAKKGNISLPHGSWSKGSVATSLLKGAHILNSLLNVWGGPCHLMATRLFINHSPIYTPSCDLWPLHLSTDSWAWMSDRQLTPRMFTAEPVLFPSSKMLLPRPQLLRPSTSPSVDPTAGPKSQDLILTPLSLTLHMQSTSKPSRFSEHILDSALLSTIVEASWSKGSSIHLAALLPCLPPLHLFKLKAALKIYICSCNGPFLV